MKIQKCIITGTTGYIGKNLLSLFKKNNWKILEFKRSGNNQLSNEFKYSLGNTPEPSIFKNYDYLIHCSYDFNLTTWEEIKKTNIEGTLKLIEAAIRGGIKKIIFISSIAAHSNSKSLYGRAKFSIEQALKIYPQVTIIRPGMVFGKTHKGTFNSLENWVVKLPVIPLISHAGPLFACHIEDLSKFILNTITSDGEGFFYAGHHTPMEFRDVLINIKKKNKIKKLIIHIPWWLPWAVLRVFELFHIPIPFRSDAILVIISRNKSLTFIKSPYITFRNFFTY